MADRSDLGGSGYSIPYAKPHLLEFALEMPDVGLANPFQAYRSNPLSQA